MTNSVEWVELVVNIDFNYDNGGQNHTINLPKCNECSALLLYSSEDINKHLAWHTTVKVKK